MMGHLWSADQQPARNRHMSRAQLPVHTLVTVGHVQKVVFLVVLLHLHMHMLK